MPNNETWEERWRSLLNGLGTPSSLFNSKKVMVREDVDEVKRFIESELTLAHREEQSDMNMAIKSLARIADFNAVTPEMSQTATMLIQAKQDYDKTQYVRFLEEELKRVSALLSPTSITRNEEMQ